MTKGDAAPQSKGEDDTVQSSESPNLESSEVAKRLQPDDGQTTSGEEKGVVDVSSVWETYKKESYSRGVPKGRPKSGRKWKTEQTTRFSDMKQDKPFRTSWQKKMKDRAERKSVKKYEQELKEQRDKEREIKRKKIAEKKKRKFENQRKAEIVQVIKNPAKIKRMKKKQLRYIEKRDTNKMLQEKS